MPRSQRNQQVVDVGMVSPGFYFVAPFTTTHRSGKVHTVPRALFFKGNDTHYYKFHTPEESSVESSLVSQSKIGKVERVFVIIGSISRKQFNKLVEDLRDGKLQPSDIPAELIFHN